MGEMADYFAEQSIFDMPDERHTDDYRCIAQRIWVTEDGTEIKVKDMDTEHIANALAMLKRRGFVGPSTLRFYLTTLGPNGTHAQDEFEREMDQAFDAPVSSFIDFFEEELKNRAGKSECPVYVTGKPSCPNCGNKR